MELVYGSWALFTDDEPLVGGVEETLFTSRTNRASETPLQRAVARA
jgi:hypothetical protein